jgi:hypothetical protein
MLLSLATLQNAPPQCISDLSNCEGKHVVNITWIEIVPVIVIIVLALGWYYRWQRQ